MPATIAPRSGASTPGWDDWDTAHHEAGHAVMGCLVGRLPLSATIVRRGPVAGEVIFEPTTQRFRYFDTSPEKRELARQRVYTELAGTIAHDLYKPGREHDIADETDLQFTHDLIIELVSWEDRDSYLAEAQRGATLLLAQNRAWLDAVAAALLKDGTLVREQILSLRPSP